MFKDRFQTVNDNSNIKFQHLSDMLEKIGKQIDLQRHASDQMLEQKSITLDALQSKVADIIAEDLQQQEAT